MKSAWVVAVATMAAVAGGALECAHAEKREQTSVKSSQRSVAKSTTAIGDVPNHEVFQETLISAVKYANPDYKVTEEWVFNQVDQTDGAGAHRGYWIHFHEGGEQTYGTYQGNHRTVSNADGSWLSSWEGKHQFTGGTGKYKNIKGAGTYRGKVGSSQVFIEEAREQIEY